MLVLTIFGSCVSTVHASHQNFFCHLQKFLSWIPSEGDKYLQSSVLDICVHLCTAYVSARFLVLFYDMFFMKFFEPIIPYDILRRYTPNLGCSTYDMKVCLTISCFSCSSILRFWLISPIHCRTPIITVETNTLTYHYGDIMARWYGMDRSPLGSPNFLFQTAGLYYLGFYLANLLSHIFFVKIVHNETR